MKRDRRWMTGQRKADSKWEADLAEGILKVCRFHEDRDKVNYSIPKSYTPDFVYETEEEIIYIEAKGRFMDREEARKYIFIRDALLLREVKPTRFVFLFYDPKKPFPHAKKRKDGTKMSHAEWSDKQGIEWYTVDTIKELLQ